MGGAIGLSKGDQASIQRTADFIDQTGFIPDAAVVDLKAGMSSKDQAEFVASHAVADGFWRTYPGAFVQAFGDEGVKAIQDYDARVQLFPAEEVWSQMNPNRDPTTRKLMDDLRQEGHKLVAETEIGDILPALDPRGFWDMFGGKGFAEPADPIQTRELLDDYRTLFAERYAETRGNEDLSRDQALERLQIKWGSTDVGTAIRVVAYPPERYYNTVGGDHDWMGDQLEEIVTAQFGEVQAFGIRSTTETQAAVSRGNMRGEPPPYEVYVLKDGAFLPLRDPQTNAVALIQFDWQRAWDKREAGFAEDQRANEAFQQGVREKIGQPAINYTTGGRF
jgi:hypothetical protein